MKTNTTFKAYPKIHRLGKEETEGILGFNCHIQEKIDGANTSIWIDKRGEIACGSRNRELTEGFNGFVDYVAESVAIQSIMRDNPHYRLYGEWLVPHTIQYRDDAYRHFYLFDIAMVGDGEKQEEFLPVPMVNKIAEVYGIKTPHYFGEHTGITQEELERIVGTSKIGDKGEGVVIKSDDFIDKYGNKTYAKVVTQGFKEDNAVVFGGNNKHSDTYWETYIMNKYITVPRVEKIMRKLQPVIDEKLDMEHTSRVANTVYHDMVTEEIWEIQKKAHAVNFKKLRDLCLKKAIRTYHDILNGHKSVAYSDN